MWRELGVFFGFLVLWIKEFKNGFKRMILLEFKRKVLGRVCCKF